MISWAIETLVATTLLMLGVLVLRAPVRKAFGPGVAYALWAIPAIRMVMPPLPGDWQLSRLIEPFARQVTETQATIDTVKLPALAARELADKAVLDAKLALAGRAIETVDVAPAALHGPDIALIALGLWIAGVLGFLGYHLVSHGLYCRRLLRRARIDRTVADGRVRVIETDAAHGPLAFGIWRKYVAFPRDFSERYDEVERDLALAHELGHHVRGDLIANWLALIVLALHWFNPVAWRAFRAFRADQEMACDALVLAGRAQALRHAYGRAIVKSAHGGAVSAACHLHTINELKGRLRMLSKTRKLSPVRIGAGIVGVTALSLAALGLTASGSQAAERIKVKVAAATGIDLAGQDVPAPPAPPRAPKAPAAPDAPVPPPAPDVVLEKHQIEVKVGEPGQDGKKKVIIVRRDGGDPQVIDLPSEDDIAAMIPDVQSRNCKGEGDGKTMVWKTPEKADGKTKQRIVICVDRIEAHAKVAAEMGKSMGLKSALMGLKHARAAIEAQTELSAEQKAEALAGIDKAIAEIAREAASDD